MRTLMFNVLRNWSVISGDVIPKKKNPDCFDTEYLLISSYMICFSLYDKWLYILQKSKTAAAYPFRILYGSTYNWINGNYFYLLTFLLSQLISQFSEEGFKLQNLWLNVLIIKKYTLHKNLVYHQRKFRNIN